MKKNTYFRRRAFTLIELMVVVAIIGILATMISINLMGAQAKGRDTKRKADLSTIMSAIVMYGADHGGVLPGADGLIETTEFAAIARVNYPTFNVELDKTIREGGYIDKMPVDPRCVGANCEFVNNIHDMTGYTYFRGDFIAVHSNSPGGGFTCASASEDFGTRKGFVYAHLESPSLEDSGTMSTNMDTCVALCYTYSCSGLGAAPNFKVSN